MISVVIIRNLTKMVRRDEEQHFTYYINHAIFHNQWLIRVEECCKGRFRKRWIINFSLVIIYIFFITRTIHLKTIFLASVGLRSKFDYVTFCCKIRLKDSLFYWLVGNVGILYYKGRSAWNKTNRETSTFYEFIK